MGSKKSKTVKKVTVINKVVKLTYLQTLAVSNNLANTKNLETESKKLSSKSKEGKSTLAKVGVALGSVGGLLGVGKKSKKTKVKTGGVKVIDQWLQPYFDKIRYAIGIRELSVSRYIFAETSELISTPYLSPKEIIKVHLLSDEYIPPQFDNNLAWIRYFIKPENSKEWIPISPLNGPTRFDDTGNIIPKILNFNLPKPTTAQLEDKFIYTDELVKIIRLRAVLSRPQGGENDSITPLLKSYKMVFTPRS